MTAAVEGDVDRVSKGPHPTILVPEEAWRRRYARTVSALELVDLADDASYARFHDVYRACYDRPFDQPWGAPEKRVNLGDDAYGRHVLVLVREGDVALGGGWVSLPLKDNRGDAYVEVFVRASRRRQGLGSRILAALVETASAAGRTRLRAEAVWGVGAGPEGTEEPGPAFCRSHGFEVDILDAVRELPLPVADLSPPAVADGYRLLDWRLCPERWLVQYAGLRHVLLQEAPSGPVGHENEFWDAERVRHEEREWHDQGRVAQTCAVVAPDGRLAGHTQLVFAADGVEAYQWDTLVLPEHRGHGLGLALKRQAMHAAADLLAGRRRITTWNAASNTPMIAVNEMLGYRQSAWAAEYVRSL